MRAVILGCDQETRRVLVEPVHDARAAHATNAGQARTAMGDQGVDQRSCRVSRSRVHHKARGLVDDDDVLVLVDDLKRDRLAPGFGFDRLRQVDYDRLARRDMISGVAHGGGSDPHLAFEDQRFQPRPRQLGQSRREHAVEAHETFGAGDGDAVLTGEI